jgi:hypothetical protein
MATARELLEQADALMRRNRARSDVSDIPVLTDIVAGTALAEQADVPVLTDAVEEVVVDDIVPLPAEAPRRQTAAFEGDPSDWLVADTVDPAIYSITGHAPDTLAVVPAVTLKAGGSGATPPPEASQQRSWVQRLVPSVFGSRETPAAQPSPEIEQGAHAQAGAPPVPELSGAPALDAAAAVAEDDSGPQEVADAQAPPLIDEDADEREPPLHLDWPREEFEAPAREEPEEFAEHASQHALRSADGAAPAMTELPPAEPEPQPSADSADPEDEERWQALSEQISMQVLQRVDLFTDTGLKEQLAAHQQPIVERAGAELVGAITLHVGRLLKVYVAEAIEREIAQWRDSQR